MNYVLKIRLVVFLLLALIASMSSASTPHLGSFPEDDWRILSKALVNTKLPVTWRDSHGESIVNLQLHFGSEDVAVKYLKQATKEEFRKLDIGNIFHSAIIFGSQRVVQTLLEKGVSPNILSGNGGAPLTASIYFGRLEITRMLIRKKADIHYKNNEALKEALSRGNFMALQILLDSGVNLEPYRMKENNGELLFYAISGKSLDTLSFLMRNGFHPNALSDEGDTSLTYALLANSGIGVITQLLNFGADQCLKNRSGETPQKIVQLKKEKGEHWIQDYDDIFTKKCEA